MGKTVFAFLYAFIIMAYTLCAQHVQILPPSPEAASLNKYVEYPVSYFSGLPQINIPIYEVRVDDVVLPISLSYHGGGIQADEEASRVGLGWTLNAGGAVIRSMRGLPDELVSGNLGNEPPTTENIMAPPNYGYRGYEKLTPIDKYVLKHVREKRMTNFPHEVSDNPEIAFNYFVQNWLNRFYYRSGTIDIAPDNYSFNFLNHSGSFMLEEPLFNSAIMRTESPVKLKKRTNYGFIFEDKDKNIYYFEEGETSSYPWPMTERPDSIHYKSAWYLNKIETPQGGTITFTYTEMPQIRMYAGVGEEREFNWFTCLPVYHTHSESFSRVRSKRLDKIETRDLKIEFISSNETRKDIYNDKSRLDYIIIKNQQDEVLKKIGFTYSYFDSSEPYGTTELHRPLYYRLKLDEIKEHSITGNASQSLYKFSYHGNGSIPDKGTYKRDYWGYFNNNTAPATMIPRVKPPLGNPVGPGTPANRNPNSSEMIKGTLSSIIYSTGGKTNFIWEAHDYSYIGQKRVNQSTGLPPVEKPILTEKLCGLKSNKLEKLSIDIRVTVLRQVKLYVNNYYRGLNEFMVPGLFDSYHIPYEEGIQVPLVKIYYLGGSGNEAPILKNVFILNKSFCDNYANKPYYYFAPELKGYYRIVLENPRGNMKNYSTGYGMLRMFEDEGYFQDGSTYGNIPIEYERETESSSGVNPNELAGMAMAGGLRIKQIQSITDKDTIRKDYLYREKDMPLNSSGVLVAAPNCYSYFWRYGVCGTLDQNLEGGLIDVLNADGIYKTFPSKQNVEYGVVMEYLNRPEIGENIAENYSRYSRTEHYFSTVKDNELYADEDDTSYSLYQSASSRIRTYKGHWRGNLMKEITYKENIPIQTANYDYYIYEDKNNYFFNGDLFITVDFGGTAFDCAYDGYRINPDRNFAMSKYRLIPYNKMIKSKKIKTKSLEVIRADDGDPSLSYKNQEYEETVNYNYPYNEYNTDLFATTPVSEEQTTSDGKKAIIYYTYHKNGGKIHTQVKVINGFIIEGRRFEYDSRWLLTNTYVTAIAPDASISVSSYGLGSHTASSALLNLINDPEYTYVYQTIDNRPLIKEVQQKEFSTYYIWGYKGSHPVAEIRVPRADGTPSVTGIGLTSQTVFDHTSTESIIEGLRTRYPTAEITTFTYHWMLGLYSRTDPRGVTTYYEYDDYGRMKRILDYNKHVIEQYDYHYRN